MQIQKRRQLQATFSEFLKQFSLFLTPQDQILVSPQERNSKVKHKKDKQQTTKKGFFTSITINLMKKKTTE